MNTYEVLVDFFSGHPEYLTLATENYPSHNPSHVDMWEVLFGHVFNGDTPVDVEHNNHPLYRRLGSTDPRWDVLIRKDGFGLGKAMDQFLHDYMSGAVCITKVQEAA